MERLKYLILGAGPSGLSVAQTLKDLGETSLLLLEKEDQAGGLCRSWEVDGKPLDIGGGHFLDVRRKDALDLIFRFMARSEWAEFSRLSTIKLRGLELDYPLEANLWQLPMVVRLDFLESLAQAGCVRGLPMPETFEEWIVWKLGSRIAEEYMLPYNRKIWSIELKELGTYWLCKLPEVSFRESLQSCLEHSSVGSLPAHGTFLYPRRFGYGETWRRMGEALGDQLATGETVKCIDLKRRIVNGRYQADHIITTIPWTVWPLMMRLPAEVGSAISQLCYSSIDIDYHPQTIDSHAHWIYDPDESVDHHRILCRSNFCQGARGYWTETNSKRRSTPTQGTFHNEYAYPLNTRSKPGSISTVVRWAREHQIFPLGRWGTWEHLNSDVAVSQAIALGRHLKLNTPWAP